MSFIAKFGGKNVEGQILLHLAAKNGDTFLLQQLLDKGASVQILCTKGFSALHYAVESQNLKNIELLLKKGASIHSRDKEGKTPLDLAFDIYTNSQSKLNLKSAILILLLSHSSMDEKGLSAFLFLAIQNNDEKFFKFLLKKGSILKIHSIFEDDRSPLHVAAANGNTKMVELLIQNGADIEAKTLNGETPLHQASAAGNVEVIKKLLQFGGHIESSDNDGNIPLHHAIKNNKREIVLLLNNFPKTQINTITKIGSTNLSLLHYAVMRNDEEFFKMALDSDNVDLNPRTKDGETPLHFGIIYNRLKFIYELVKRGAEINVKSSNGETPLHLSAALGQSHTVGYLLKNGADVNSVTTLGSTPLHYILDRERCNDIIGGYNRPLSLLDELKTRLTIIKILIKNQALVNVKDYYSKSPLHYAVIMNVINKNNIKYRLETIKCLVNHGADLNATCERDLTPIFYGFDTWDEKILWWFICRGTNINRKPKNSDSLLSKAIKLRSAKMVGVLLDAGASIDSQNIFEASNHESSKTDRYEILEMLTNQTFNIETVIIIIRRLLADVQLIERDDIINRLIVILVKRKINNEIIIDDFGFDENSRLLKYRFKVCEKQILKMKKTRFTNDNSTLYDILMTSVEKLANYAKYQKLSEFLKLDSTVQMFPICISYLENHYKKARERRLLLDFSIESLINLVHKAYDIKLPRDVSFKISEYLNMVDLTHLMLCKVNQKLS